MIPVTTFAGKKVAVFGLGGSGLASARALLAGGADVVAFDDNAESVAQGARGRHPDRRSARHRLVEDRGAGAGARRAADPSGAALVGRTCAQTAGVEVIGDIELFCRERRKLAPDAPFVAITGTNGKSTTTALIAHICCVAAGLDAQLGGNIGTADPVARAARARIASTSSNARPIRSISRPRSIPRSAF